MLPPEISDSQDGARPDERADERVGDAQPLTAQPAGAQPLTGQPAEAQPFTAQPGEAQPLTAQPAGAQPLTAQPAEAQPAEAQPPPAEADSTGGRRGMRWPVVLGVATVLLGGFGIWATLAAHNLRSTSGGQNVALTDQAATSAVTRQVSGAVNTIFSYSYADTAKTRRAAQGLLTGQAIRQYNKLFALVQQEAPKEKLVVTTTVTNSGVEYLTGGTARVLIFANQQDTRAGTSQATYAGAMFAVTAVRQGGKWKIENIDTFTG